MSWRGIIILLLVCSPSFGQEQAGGPADEKAQKTFRQAVDLEKKHQTGWALDGFKKADKQDGGHCIACQQKMVKYGIELREWKIAEAAAGELIAEARDGQAKAVAYYQSGRVLLDEGIDKKKEDLFARAHEEMTRALASYGNFPNAVFSDGLALAHLKQDDAAKARFQQFAKMQSEDDLDRQRALRYVSQPELARARMAPAFAVTTTDGQRVSLDGLQGKVVLIDFWATWCGPCREAMPHMKQLAKKFEGQPLFVLSVSLDSDEQKWKEFIAHNEMTWPQCWGEGFEGALARMFDVHAIPHTFTIDADGVLQDEHIGDASLDGKIKKLIARAHELEVAQKPAQ